MKRGTHAGERSMVSERQPRDEIRGRGGLLACLKPARRRPSQSISASPRESPLTLPLSQTLATYTCCRLPFLPEYTSAALHALCEFSGPFNSDDAPCSSLTCSVARDVRPTRAGAPKHAASSKSPPYLNIKLPDLSAPPPEREVHIVS
jgi:hypothetical protein